MTDRIVTSQKDAERLAVERSRSHGHRADQARKFARDWFDRTPADIRLVSYLTSDFDSFERLKVQSKADFARTLHRLEDIQHAWGMEITKHLATFNGAGLAGCAALLASKFSGEWNVKAALVVFGIGAGFALLAMWTAALALEKRHEAFERADTETQNATTWRPFIAGFDKCNSASATRWERAHVFTSWLSGLSGAVSGVLLSLALFAKGAGSAG